MNKDSTSKIALFINNINQHIHRPKAKSPSDFSRSIILQYATATKKNTWGIIALN